MTEHGIRGKKVWRSMFLSYMLIILLCFFLYSGFMIYETYVSARERTERESVLKAQEIANLIDQRLLSAQSITTRINASSTIKKLYMSVLSQGENLDSYTLYSILNEMKMVYSSARRLDIDEIVIFVDTYSKAYSFSGVLLLNEPFEERGGQPFVAVDTINNALSVNGKGKLTFEKQGLLCVSGYTYSTGANRGSIAVLFNMDSLTADIREVLGGEAGVQITLQGKELLQEGELSGKAYHSDSGVMPELSVELYRSGIGVPSDTLRLMILMLSLSLFITLCFFVLAYYFSRRHYRPIGDIGQLVATGLANDDGDEMSGILNGIKSLIGERNGYRERMVTIAPYAQQGLLHGVLTGNVRTDAVQVLSTEDYLDLQKPFFAISAVNIHFLQPVPDEVEFGRELRETCDKVSSIFSTEERSIYTFRRDVKNLFLVINSNTEESLDELFVQIHKFLSESLGEDSCLVTMGVDDIRDDLSQLQDSCQRAITAVDEMMISGRGEVYFYEQGDAEGESAYYFPKNSDLKLAKLVKEGNLEEINAFLDELYDKNMARSGLSIPVLRAMVDELHIATLRCVKECTEANTTHIRVEKIFEVAPLDEIFAYYKAVFQTLVETIPSKTDEADSDSSLANAILLYIDDNFRNPEMSLQHLMDQFGVSGKYISLVCKNRRGKTYLQYLQDKRIEYAMTLLRDESYPLEQVAEMCGYQNALTFRRNFKSHTGVTPSEYRQQKS